MRSLLALLLCFALALPGLAQDTPTPPQDADPTPFASGGGLQILLTNFGFGLGGYSFHEIGPGTSITFDGYLTSGKHESETAFWSGFERIVPNKHSYLLMMPVRVGVQQRLFASHIQDNFRPFIAGGAGPTLGYEYPYFNDCNGNDVRDRLACGEDGLQDEERYDPLGSLFKGDFRMGMGGYVALGAHFGRSTRNSQGVRIGYSFNYFFTPIQLLVPPVLPDGQQFFGSPFVSVEFGRLF